MVKSESFAMFSSNVALEELVLSFALAKLSLTFGCILLYSPVVNCHAGCHGEALQATLAVIRLGALLVCPFTIRFER